MLFAFVEMICMKMVWIRERENVVEWDGGGALRFIIFSFSLRK